MTVTAKGDPEPLPTGWAAQLPLHIGLRKSFEFSSLFPGNNALAIQAVIDLAGSDSEPYVFLSGAAETGKTHLLQAACRAVSENEGLACYIPLGELDSLQTGMLAGLETAKLVALDDLHAIAGESEWESAIFHLFNRLRDHRGKLLIAALDPPRALPIVLSDLKSRLSWGPAYRLQPLDDSQLSAALTFLAHQRGMTLPAETASYILKRWRRDLRSLRELVESLDRASLSAQRKLTVPFVREAIATMALRPASPEDSA